MTTDPPPDRPLEPAPGPQAPSGVPRLVLSRLGGGMSGRAPTAPASLGGLSRAQEATAKLAVRAASPGLAGIVEQAWREPAG
ncbi:hypothetical protein [Amycolatopsis sp. cmx-4-68]|uniref:hypothetical protein n=1 Tax=Amycolatopsis sp. cmx-4-68 TaxID=2790938 RepID=UPI00397A5501